MPLCENAIEAPKQNSGWQLRGLKCLLESYESWTMLKLAVQARTQPASTCKPHMGAKALAQILHQLAYCQKVPGLKT